VVSLSGLKFVLCCLFRPFASRVKQSAQGRQECEYTYPAGKLSVTEHSAPWLLPGGAGGVPGCGGIGSGVGCHRQLGGGASGTLNLQHICWVLVVPLSRKVSGQVDLMKHRRVSFYHSLHHIMPSRVNTLLLLFSDFGMRFLHQIFYFPYCRLWKTSFGHFGHIQGQVHLGLFQLYPMSMPRHSSRHVENVQETRCGF